ncbi:MAG: GNAT family N-acetyltransferase [Oscillospiraceae bacterium]|nr:GNAT family N-acetyltransferase [Oscillospiraceae bacterium]
MHIRVLTPDDHAAHCRVSSLAFHWQLKLEEESFPTDVSMLGYFADDGELIAELEFSTREVWFGTKTLPIVCVGGVASVPHRRREGAVRRLFEELERLAPQNNWILGGLYPFKTKYYRQFGYESVVDYVQTVVPLPQLDDLAARSPKDMGRMELMEGDAHLPELLDVYNTYARSHYLMFKRTDGKMFGLDPTGECKYTCLWRDQNGAAQGYMSYQLNLGVQQLQVSEIAALTPDALRGMLCYLRGYASKVKEVLFFTLPANSPVFSMLNENRAMQMCYQPNTSVRIYDFKAFLAARTYPKQAGRFSFAITDDTLAANNRTYHVAYQDGVAQLLPAGDIAPALTLDRAAAALVMLSGKAFTPFALQCADSVTLSQNPNAQNEIDDFLRAFAGQSPECFDSF